MILATVFKTIVDFLRYIRGRRFQGRIIDLPFGLILKISSPRGTKDSEADIIHFVQRHTHIPTPRVLASAEGHGSRYLLMKKAGGRELETVWATLESTQRRRIVEQLRSFISQLRSLQSPHGRAVCSLSGAALRDSRVTISAAIGPFTDEDAFNDRLIETSAWFDQRVTFPAFRSRLRGDHAIVLTHGDIAPRNILVDGGTIVALIDWEQAGWYPEHWEMVKARWCPPDPEPAGDLWIEAVKDLFDEDYEAEWQVERELSERIVGFF